MNDIFSVSNLLESNFMEPTNVEKIDIRESYFLSALSYLEEIDAEMRDNTKVLYKSILEAENDQIAINESFSSFAKSIKTIIDKFIAFINRIIKRFVLALNKLAKSDKYIEKNKDRLVKFNGKQFEMDIFNFTYLADDNVPLLEPKVDWSTENGLGNEYNSTSKDLLTGVTSIYNNFKDNMADSICNFRAQVLGSKANREHIESEDFAEELFMLFRDGITESSKEEISATDVNEAYDRFKGYNKNLSSINTNKRNMEKGYASIKKEIDQWFSGMNGKTPLDAIYKNNTISKDDGQYVEYKDDIDGIVNLIAKAKMSEIDSKTRTHALAFTAKLDAIKDCFVQDKKILYKALSMVIKESTEMEDN